MPAPVTHPRHNAKARGSVAGGSHKKRKRPATKPASLGEDGTADAQTTILPLGAELPGDDERGKMSSKKRKRLDSYVAKKLKSEQRLRTINLLASLRPTATTSEALASTSTLGQNPLAPSSARERVEKREDRLVRRGIDVLSKRHGEERSESESDPGSEASSSREDKGKARSIDLETGEEIPPPAPRHRKETPSKKMSQTNWNPNLLATQPQSESSDFDSSDSEHDSLDEAGPSTAIPTLLAKRSPTPPVLSNAVLSNAVHFDDKAVTRPPPPTIPGPGLGGALRRRGDGEAMQPRLVKRARKKSLSVISRIDEGEGDSDESGESSASASQEDDEDRDSVEHASLSGADEDVDAEEQSEDLEDQENEHKDEEGDESGRDPPLEPRAAGFKAWARTQMGQIIQPHALDPPIPPSSKPRPPDSQAGPPSKTTFVGPLGGQLEIPSSSLLELNGGPSKPSARPTITRRPSVTEQRMELPILAEEQAIVEAIRLYPVVIIAGETGSGKTTQVPQMLFEAGFGFKGSDDPGMIAITQPRRVAAVSLSARVKSELNLSASSSVVAHQIRYSSTTSSSTAIKFMTDGVLLRELASDFLLSRYSCVIVDEAHERGVNTDVLIGVLSRVARLREKMWREKKDTRPLRIVIMSATLRIEDFAANSVLFGVPPPVIRIPARQHSVTVHFSRRTVSDYVGEAYKKVCKIHARLPPGGILVFLTGQGEIQALCRKLEKRYGAKAETERLYRKRGGDVQPAHHPVQPPVSAEEPETEDIELGQQDDLAADVDDGVEEDDPEALDSDDEDGVADMEIDEASIVPMHVLPLYSLLPTDQQMLVFRPPPTDHRLVIIATNVAETSLTIPGIRYVVDSGRAKERQYDPSTGVQAFQVSWISKASASQRTGRAGRTGPGHCYRLYSSALFEDHFVQFSKPEILRMPIEGVVLQMKSMNIDQVVNFPFPTPPDRSALKKAEDLLLTLGALSAATSTRMINGVQQVGSTGGQVTELGKAMAGYPVSPRFAKMLAIGSQHGALPYVVAVVACLSVGDPFLHEQNVDEAERDEDEKDDGPPELAHIRSQELREKEERKEIRRRYFKAHSQFLSLGGGTSDMFKMLAAVGAYEYETTPSFCAKSFLRLKAMQEIQQLRSQISAIAKLPMTRLSPPNEIQLKVLRQIITAGFIDQVAVRSDVALKRPARFTSSRSIPYRAAGITEDIFIHPSSALFHRAPPEFVVFQEIVRTSRPWMRVVTQINPAWLSALGKGMCSYSRPTEVGREGGSKVAEVKEGERVVSVVPHFRDLGVDLPAVKMRQRREGTRWVLVE